jgi:hypothetical protein
MGIDFKDYLLRRRLTLAQMLAADHIETKQSARALVDAIGLDVDDAMLHEALPKKHAVVAKTDDKPEDKTETPPEKSKRRNKIGEQ